MEGASKLNWGLELYNGDNGKQFKMGESPSFGTLASARGLAKLAAAMADRGQASIIIKILFHQQHQQLYDELLS